MSLLFLALMMASPQPGSREADPRWEYRLGSRLPKPVPTTEYQAVEVRKIQLRYGECVVKKHPTEARQFVLTNNYEGADFKKNLNAVGDGVCLAAVASDVGQAIMQFPADTMKYTLADALVRSEIRQPLPSLENAPAIDQPKLDESKYMPKPGVKVTAKLLTQLADYRAGRATLIYLAEFGECVVRKNPSQAHALLMADPASPQEDSTLQAIYPSLGGCMTAGQTIKFNRSILRGTIAMNYYRLALASGPAPLQSKISK